MIQFCMASLLATLVLDDDAMELIRERSEAPLLFEACIVLLTSTLDKLHVELERQLSGYYEDETQVGLCVGGVHWRLGPGCRPCHSGSRLRPRAALQHASISTTCLRN